VSDIVERLPIQLRTEALEQLLVEKGLIDPAVMDKFISTYEHDVGPLNGAKVVAKAWTDPDYRARLLDEGTAAIAELPPSWYKDPAYRARVVREPRTVLSEMGLDLDADTEIKVWDSSSEVRFFVLPQRPAGTEGLSEAELAGLVSRDAMVGVATVAAPS
jgi:nitrile hydratase